MNAVPRAAPSSTFWRRLRWTSLIAALVSVSCGDVDVKSGPTVPFQLRMPSGSVVTATGHRAHARASGNRVPGICGQANARDGEDGFDYCVYVTPGVPDAAAVVSLSSNRPDVLVVVAVPAADLSVRFESDHGAVTQGTVVSVPGAEAPQLGVIAISRRALGGRVVVARARQDYRLVSSHLDSDACSTPDGGLRLCSIGLRFSPRGAAAEQARRPKGTLT